MSELTSSAYPPSYEQGHKLFQMGKINESIKVFEAFLTQKPNHVPAAYLLGVCYFRKQQFSQAELQLRKAISLDDSHYNAHYYLGLSLERQNRLSDALVEYKLALAIKPDFQEAQNKLNAHSQAVSPAVPVVKSEKLVRSEVKEPELIQVERVSLDRELTAEELVRGRISGNLLYEGNRRPSSFSGAFLFANLCLLVSVFLWITTLRTPYVGLVSSEAVVSTALFIFIWLLLWINSRTTKYTVYEHRIDFQTGIFSKRERSIWIYQIEDTWLNRSFFNLLTNDASVHFKVTGLETLNKKQDLEITGLGNYRFMKNFWEEIRDATFKHRWALKKWWV